MILVILGSTHFAFDRLVKEVDYLVCNKKINDSVFIQLGSCKYEPIHCRWKRFFSFEEMCEKIEMAELVISHGGAGTTLLCIQLGKRAILVPRKKKFKEAVDDHQVIFARKMEDLGHVNVAFEIRNLAHLIQINKNNKNFGNSVKSHLTELKKYLVDLFVSWDN